MTSELITFNHLRCHSSSTALGTRTGYWEPTRRGTDGTLRSQLRVQLLEFSVQGWQPRSQLSRSTRNSQNCVCNESESYIAGIFPVVDPELTYLQQIWWSKQFFFKFIFTTFGLVYDRNVKVCLVKFILQNKSSATSKKYDPIVHCVGLTLV